MRESLVQVDVRMEFGRQPDFVVWRNSTGFDSVSNVRYGLCVGSADLIGIAPGGRFLAVEIKTESGRLSKEQRLFLELVLSMGGVSCVTRSKEEARDQIRRIRAGERRFFV